MRNILLFVVVFTGYLSRAQTAPWSAGLRGVGLYDIHSPERDGPLADDPHGWQDAAGTPNWGAELWVEYFANPLLGFQLQGRFGHLAGANQREFYENEFTELRVAMLLNWTSLSLDAADRRWHFYNSAGLLHGRFKAQRFLQQDGALNHGLHSQHYGFFGGLGTSFQLAKAWRLNFEVQANLVQHDGFDGFDYGTAWEPYASAGLGLIYTFGTKHKAARHTQSSLNLVITGERKPPYPEKVKAADSTAQIVQALRDSVQDLSQRLAQLENKANSGMPPTVVSPMPALADRLPVPQRDSLEVYFENALSGLSAEAKAVLRQNLNFNQGSVRLVGYSSSTGSLEKNLELKQARVRAVQAFLVEELGFAPQQIKLEVALFEASGPDPSFRKVVVLFNRL